jgi:glutathione S-transferase
MKLYYYPGACSLADHIALREAGTAFQSESVDLKAKRTASGEDFNRVSGKGYVPVLVLDDGEVITENIAILDYLATKFPELAPGGALGRTRLLEALAYISTELHKGFKPFWADAGDAEKRAAAAQITRRMRFLADYMQGEYLFGDRPTAADFYLFVMMLWAERFGVAIPPALAGMGERLRARPAVQTALEVEGLL